MHDAEDADFGNMPRFFHGPRLPYEQMHAAANEDLVGPASGDKTTGSIGSETNKQRQDRPLPRGKTIKLNDTNLEITPRE